MTLNLRDPSSRIHWPGKPDAGANGRAEDWTRFAYVPTGAMRSSIAPFLETTDEFAARLETCTESQIHVLWLMSCGLLNKQIAHVCGLAESTVKAHVSGALKRLRIRSRTEAAVRFAVFLERCRARVRDEVVRAS